jgi:hypothetical protein
MNTDGVKASLSKYSVGRVVRFRDIGAVVTRADSVALMPGLAMGGGIV